jgi:acyl-CoA synthetase (NDP forming)
MPDLTPLLWPRSVAVVGASPDREVIRGRLTHVLLLWPFDGPIYPVTRSHAEVHGRPAYPSIAALPGPVDLAVIAIPAAAVPEALEACGARGVRAAIVLSSGFAEERGETGPALQARLRQIAAGHGIVLCGPNCEGLVNTMASLCATFSPSLENAAVSLLPDVGRGRAIGVTSQSGGISFSFFNRGRPRQLRFSYIVSTGNEAVLEGLDYVEWMLADGRTDIFLMYVEALRDGAKFRSVASRAADLGRPLIVAKMGRSEAGRRAAASHTGALAGSARVHDAMFRHHGVIASDDMDQMLDIAAAFAFCPLPRGGRVGLLSTSGGGAVWMADTLARCGLGLPGLDPETRRRIDALIPAYGSSENPVDLTAQAVREVGYARVIEILRQSPVVDVIVVIASLASEVLLERDLAALAEVVARSDKPVLFCAYTLVSPRAVTLLASVGVPTYTSLPSCARALQALVEYAAFQERRERRPVTPAAAPAGAEAAGRLRRAGPVLCEHEAKALLSGYGVPRPPEELAHDEDAAAAAAARLGYPVALKVQSPDIAHKTEAAALALDLASDAEVRAAHRRVLASALAFRPGAAIRGVLVQRMAPRGQEIVLGIARDPDFGPVLMVGLGGIHVEVLDDVAFAPVPLGPEDARALLGQLRGARLLSGVRGEAPADVEALASLMVNLSRFAAEHADLIAEIDLNPVIVHPAGQGVSVVDALIVTRTPGPPRPPRPAAIAPEGEARYR